MTMISPAEKFDPFAVIDFYYPDTTPQKEMLLKHSFSVRDKALALMEATGYALDRELIVNGALLHDVGICRCDARGILCTGSEPYIAHGILGGSMVRRYAAEHGLDLESLARICERHTGSGLAAEEIVRQNLPIPPYDWLPETPEERLICLADKFYSKSGDMQQKPLLRIRRSMEKFGEGALARFDALCDEFGVKA